MDPLYRGTGGHNYIQDEDMETSFIKQQQEEAFRQFYFMTECKACPPYEFIDDMTAQIIKNTCERVQKNLLDHAYNTDRGYLVPSEVEKIINSLLTQHNSHE